jgi:hypothetical protein
MYTLSHGDAEHIDLKNASASMIGTEPPESNVVNTSSLEHIGISCLEVSEGQMLKFTSQQIILRKYLTRYFLHQHQS